MKKIRNILLSLSAVLVISASISTMNSSNVMGLPFTEAYQGVFNLNDDTNKDDEMFFSKNGTIYKLGCKSYLMSINYIVDSSIKNINNDYLGLSKEYKIRKLKGQGCNIYRAEVKEQAELNSLFENAQKLCDEGKIKNVYTLAYSDFPILEKDEAGVYLQLDMISTANLRNYYIYNEESIIASIISGDINEDLDLNVRDCAKLASELSHGNNNFTDTVDYNDDGSIDVRDAAAIASELAKR